MKIQQLIYFQEVADTLHFTKAADNLYVSQSSLSHAIQSLEDELGVPLFIRKSGKKVTLSKYGEKFLRHTQTILSDISIARQDMESMRNPEGGIVNIAFSYTNGISLVPAVFKKFYNENENNEITIRFQINNSQNMFENDVLTNKVDLAFSCTSKYDGLESVEITKQKLVAAFPADHPLANAKKVKISDLKDENFIGYYRGWNLSRWIESMFADYGIKPNIIEFYSDWSLQISAIALGSGIGIMPELPVDTSLIKLVPIDSPKQFRPVYLHWKKDAELTPAVTYVRDFCLKYFNIK